MQHERQALPNCCVSANHSQNQAYSDIRCAEQILVQINKRLRVNST